MKNDAYTIDVASVFSDMPYGRYEKDGVYNGTRFRRDVLVPALRKHEFIVVDFSNTLGCGSSFLDEAFAGLIAEEGFNKEEVIRRVSFESKYKSIIKNIKRYIDKS